MRKRLTILAVLVLVLNALLAAQDGACPETGWVLSTGAEAEGTKPLAHGTRAAWSKGWLVEHDDHFDKVMIYTSDGVTVLRAMMLTDRTWSPSVTHVMVPIGACVFRTAKPVGFLIWLYWGSASNYQDHDHEGIEESRRGDPQA